jgi:hypothetical protein
MSAVSPPMMGAEVHLTLLITLSVYHEIRVLIPPQGTRRGQRISPQPPGDNVSLSHNTVLE